MWGLGGFTLVGAPQELSLVVLGVVSTGVPTVETCEELLPVQLITAGDSSVEGEGAVSEEEMKSVSPLFLGQSFGCEKALHSLLVSRPVFAFTARERLQGHLAEDRAVGQLDSSQLLDHEGELVDRVHWVRLVATVQTGGLREQGALSRRRTCWSVGVVAHAVPRLHRRDWGSRGPVRELLGVGALWNRGNSGLLKEMGLSVGLGTSKGVNLGTSIRVCLCLGLCIGLSLGVLAVPVVVPVPLLICQLLAVLVQFAGGSNDCIMCLGRVMEGLPGLVPRSDHVCQQFDLLVPGVVDLAGPRLCWVHRRLGVSCSAVVLHGGWLGPGT